MGGLLIDFVGGGNRWRGGSDIWSRFSIAPMSVQLISFRHPRAQSSAVVTGTDCPGAVPSASRARSSRSDAWVSDNGVSSAMKAQNV